MLQFCEYVFKPIDVGLKVIIRVPTMQPQDMSEDTSEPSTPTHQQHQPPIIRFSKPKPRSEEKTEKHVKKPTIHIKAEAPSHDVHRVSSAKSEVNASTVSPMSIDQPERNATIREDVKPAASSTTPTTSTPNIITLPISSQRKHEKQKSQPAERASSPTTTSTHVSAQKSKHKKVVDSVTAEELKKCRRVLNKINKHGCALPFVQPVDEVLDGAPNYYKIIK